jgi:hypothetical protein
MTKNKAVPAHPGGGRPLVERPTGPGTALANFLIDYLPHLDLTNEQISAKLGYSRPNIISMWKTAKTKVTLDALWGLSEMMQVPLNYMLALYFEQYAGDNYGGTDHFPEIAKMMGRVTTEDEWEIIQIARHARQHHSLPLKSDQKSALKKLFATSSVKEEGPLREIEMNFASAGDRRTFARRGHARDQSIDEIEAAQAAKAEKGGAVKAAGRRATTHA